MSVINKDDQVFLEKLSGRKFLITGSNGMLGNSFLTQLKTHIKTPKIYCFNKSEFNV